MIFIRQEQIDAFQAAARSNLERKLLVGLRQNFTRCEEVFDESARIAFVRLGADRASRPGLSREEDIHCCLWLMMLFGSFWEKDPQFGWAAASISSADSTTVGARVARLWEHAQLWRARVMGPNDGHYLTALRGIESKSMQVLCDAPSRSQRDLMLQLASLFPQKYREVGEEPLQDLIRFAAKICDTLELLDRRAIAIVTQLMFLFGEK